MSDQNAGKVPPSPVQPGSQRSSLSPASLPPPLPSTDSASAQTTSGAGSSRAESIDDLLDDFIVQANRSHASASSAHWDLKGEPELIDAYDVEEELAVQEAAAEDGSATLAMAPSDVARAVRQPAPTAGPAPQVAGSAQAESAQAAPSAEPLSPAPWSPEQVIDRAQGSGAQSLDLLVETAAEAERTEAKEAASGVGSSDDGDSQLHQGQGKSQREQRRERAAAQRARGDSGEALENVSASAGGGAGALAAGIETQLAAAAAAHAEHAAPAATAAPKRKAVADHAAPSPKAPTRQAPAGAPESAAARSEPTRRTPAPAPRGVAVRPLPLPVPQTTQRSGIGIGTLIGAMLAAAVLTAGIVYFVTQWTGDKGPPQQAAAPPPTAPVAAEAQSAPAPVLPAPAEPVQSVAAAPKVAAQRKQAVAAPAPAPAPQRAKETPVAATEADKPPAHHPVKTRPTPDTGGVPGDAAAAEGRKPDKPQKPAKPVEKKKEEWIDPFAQ